MGQRYQQKGNVCFSQLSLADCGLDLVSGTSVRNAIQAEKLVLQPECDALKELINFYRPYGYGNVLKHIFRSWRREQAVLSALEDMRFQNLFAYPKIHIPAYRRRGKKPRAECCELD